MRRKSCFRFLLNQIGLGMMVVQVFILGTSCGVLFHFLNDTLPETNCLHLNMDGWKTILSFSEGFLEYVCLASVSVVPSFS